MVKKRIVIQLSIITGLALLAGCAGNNQSDLPVSTGLVAANQTPLPTPAATPESSANPTGSPVVKGINQTLEKKEAKMPTVNVTLKTSKGDIKMELYTDKAPKTVENFLSKANSGFYNNLTFHRVEDWVVQGGDPSGNGTGGGKMPTELNDAPFVTGSLGVARGGDINVSNDAQFFICTQDCNWLDRQYTNFGKVTQGMDVVKKIAIGDKITGIVQQ
jgi:cyclophilin family peptidyl-prolyl cis-trans isomerase